VAESLISGLWAKLPFSVWIPDGGSKFASFSVFCELASQAPNATDPIPPVKKLTVLALISGKYLWQK